MTTEHVIEFPWRGGYEDSGGTIYRAVCSCDWRAPFESSERDLLVNEAKIHVEQIRKDSGKGSGNMGFKTGRAPA